MTRLDTAANVTITVPNVKRRYLGYNRRQRCCKGAGRYKNHCIGRSGNGQNHDAFGRTATITLPQTIGTTTYYVPRGRWSGQFKRRENTEHTAGYDATRSQHGSSTTGVQPTGEHLVKAGGAVDKSFQKVPLYRVHKPADIKYDTVFSENARAVTVWAGVKR